MREITRIHIAKVAYDIEIDAKEEIEDYIEALERYANDPEILSDIEIRMTELFAEHGVPAGGVITKKDVTAMRAQLGEPSDFASDEGSSTTTVDDAKVEGRRVYRDTDNAVVGGVLSGFARFFGIDPLWARLLFIVVLLGSFGTALVVYFILWLIVPPAETATDRLRMSGRAVTLASIKELVGNEEQPSKRGQTVRRVLSGVFGSLLVLMAIAGLVAIIVVVFGVQFGFGWGAFAPVAEGWIYESWWFMAMMGLFIVSGLLFSALCFVLASAVFHRKWTKRIGIAVVAIVTVGLVLFAGGVGTGMYGYASERARVLEMHETTSGDLPANFQSIKKLTFAAGVNIDGPIQYHVSDKSYYELDSLPGVKPQFEVAADGLSATVKLIRTETNWSPWDSKGGQTWRPWDSLAMPILNVYGPELEVIEAARGKNDASYSNEDGQSKIDITANGISRLSLFGGTYDTVSVTSGEGAFVSLYSAVVSELRVNGGAVEAGVIRSLYVTQPDICTSNLGIGFAPHAQDVHVRSISSGKLIYNGKEESAKSISNDCGRVTIGDGNGSEEGL